MVGKHLLELFALLTFFTVGSLAQSASLIDVLRLEGFTAFADFLIRTNTSLPAGSDADLIVYAPTNAALTRSLAAPSLLRRGVDEEEVAGSYQIAQNNKVVTNTPKRRDYHDGSGTCSAVSGPGAVDFMTFLDDPDWVNLPPNNNASIVQKNTPKGALPVVFSGLGESVKVTGLDIAFDKGVIRPVSGMFTLPHLLSATLPFLGSDKVLAALQSTRLLNELDNISGITFLAPDDRAIPAGLPNEVLADVLRQHTLLGPPIFTSDLQNGATYQTLAGTTVTVTVQCGDVFINGARILAGDAIIKNGVVHTVDKLFDTPRFVTTTITQTTFQITETVRTVTVETTLTSVIPPPPPPPPPPPVTTTVTSIIPPPPPSTLITSHKPAPHSTLTKDYGGGGHDPQPTTTEHGGSWR